MGDGIQAAKAGILEIGDVFVVNKADRDGVEATLRDLRHMISLGERRATGDWRPPVVRCIASTGEGVDDVVEALDKHFEWAKASGALDRRRLRRAANEIETIALTTLRERIGDLRDGQRMEQLAQRVVRGESDPYAAADRLLADLHALDRV
jgi:LAO/AO transport system kinase